MPDTLTMLTIDATTPLPASLEGAPGLAQIIAATASDAGSTASMPEPSMPAMPQPVHRAEPRPCRANDPVMTLIYRALDASFDAMQRELPRVWRDDTVSGVHRMRMATRRTRAVLRTFRDILPRQATRTLAEETAWLAAELGHVRDLDVHLARLERSLELLTPQSRADLEPYLTGLRTQRAVAHLGVLQSLGGERYTRLSSNFAAYLDHGPSAAALRRSRGLSAREGAERFALRALRRTRNTGRHIEQEAPPERLHKLRLRCKRLRYLLEAFEPIYGHRLQGTVKSLKRVQDALGDERDISAAIERLRAYAGADADAYATETSGDARNRCRAACQELIGLQERERAHARRRFQRAWRQFDERVRKRTLRRILRRPARDAAGS